jgi:hypothetical protein
VPHTEDAMSETAQSAASTSWTALAAGVFSFPVMCMFLLLLGWTVILRVASLIWACNSNVEGVAE